jgi:hypothetical protein
MGGIQNRLDKLMPYVKGMRFVKNTAVVDVQLKENWTIVKSDKILYQKGKNEENYFMFFSENGSSTFDDILDFVEKTINFNNTNAYRYYTLIVNETFDNINSNLTQIA